MTSPDLGSAFTACPDDTPQEVRGAPLIPHQTGYRARPFWSVMIQRTIHTQDGLKPDHHPQGPTLA
jgi:hypothetical protein